MKMLEELQPRSADSIETGRQKELQKKWYKMPRTKKEKGNEIQARNIVQNSIN